MKKAKKEEQTQEKSEQKQQKYKVSHETHMRNKLAIKIVLTFPGGNMIQGARMIILVLSNANNEVKTNAQREEQEFVIQQRV